MELALISSRPQPVSPVYNLFKPFSASLWMAVMATVLGMALLYVFLANERRAPVCAGLDMLKTIFGQCECQKEEYCIYLNHQRINN